MGQTFTDKMENAGQKVAEKATEMGHRVGEKVEEAADWAKEKSHQVGNRIDEAAQKVKHGMGMSASLGDSTGALGSTADIREHMDVFASCGTKVGKVDHVEGNEIKLTKNDSPDGMHHMIPMAWVAKVHDHVHLNKDHKQVQAEWQPA